MKKEAASEIFQRATLDDEEERQRKLRENDSFTAEDKPLDQVNPMHPDNWSGGSINPEAKAIAQGKLPPDKERGPGFPEKADSPLPPEVTRPWAPGPEYGPEKEHRDRDLRHGEH